MNEQDTFGHEWAQTRLQYAPARREQRLYHPFGAARELFYTRDSKVSLEGPAGTGKSIALLNYALLCMDTWPGCRIGLFRKTRVSLTQSTLVTWEQKVLPTLGEAGGMIWRSQEQEYRHPNGSVMPVGGLDKASRIMSSEYDIILVPEATETTEDDAEQLSTRLRNGVMPFQQLVLDCNPSYPRHWINVWCEQGKMTRLRSRHRDNPEYFDQITRQWTARGIAYLKNLQALSGVRYYRLFKGIWRQAEGLIYENWDESVHHIYAFSVPVHWTRIWVVDFGYTNPFVWQEWAIDGDGRMYLLQEIYYTGRLVEEHAKRIIALTTGQPAPAAIICDHDAEGRATLEKELGRKTIAAYKTFSDGQQATARRFKIAGDGKPRIYLFRDARRERDPSLDEKKLPTCTAEEIDGYIWDDKAKKESPVKKNDHGSDAMRYAVAYVDGFRYGEKSSGGGVKQSNAFGG